MRACLEETVPLDGREEVILRELRIVRAHSPPDDEGGLPIGVPLRLPEFLKQIDGDVPGILLFGVLNGIVNLS